MLTAISKSTSIKIIIVLIIVSITLLVGYLVNANAVGNVDSATATLVQDSLSKITKNEFGSPSAINETEINGKKLVIAEDSKNEYKVKAEDGKVITVKAKDIGSLVKNDEQTSGAQLADIAKQQLEKYYPSAIGKNYILSDSKQKNTANEKYNEFTYEEIAPNGIKTGEAVSLHVNNAGELIGLAVHEGNANISQNNQPKLTRVEAVKIALDSIKNQYEFLKDATFPQDKSELNVWQDKLVWNVEFVDVKVGNSPFAYGYFYRIDALTGDILYTSSTK